MLWDLLLDNEVQAYALVKVLSSVLPVLQVIKTGNCEWWSTQNENISHRFIPPFILLFVGQMNPQNPELASNTG